MSNRLPPEMLRRLRNEIPITLVIAEFLKLPIKVSEGCFRFLCPLCSEFITATNPKTNLARCFLCQKNFNPIDIVMVTKQVTFRNAVDYLANIKSISNCSGLFLIHYIFYGTNVLEYAIALWHE